jgi:hypothetical protein
MENINSPITPRKKVHFAEESSFTQLKHKESSNLNLGFIQKSNKTMDLFV